VIKVKIHRKIKLALWLEKREGWEKKVIGIQRRKVKGEG